MQIVFILLLLFLITPNGSYAQMLDCNKDSNCVKMVLTKGRPLMGWKFVESKAFNWQVEPCPQNTDYYFLFKNNDSLYIYKKTINCHSRILKTKFIYKTTYKIITLKYGQLGVRIFMFEPNIGKFLGRLNLGVISKNSFSDFQFVYTEKYMLTLRTNTSLTETGSIENNFE